jgi:hypothetical protein
MCEFRASDIVECIDDTPVLKESRSMPEAGRLYRVASVRRVGDGFSIRLVELTPECHLGGGCNCGNCGWDSRRFRRVTSAEEAKRSIFQELLATIPDKDLLRPILEPPCVINGRRA